MASFIFSNQISPEELTRQIANVTASEVECCLGKQRLEAADLSRLLSPAAEPYLETMARRARDQTRTRFGKIMKMYAPLYLSNECANACLYCGFHRERRIARRTLALGEVVEQAEYLHGRGFRSLLLVSGESRSKVPVNFLVECIRRLRPRFPEISVEVYPLDEAEYRSLAAAGLYGLTLYQETYLPELYAQVHGPGPKADFQHRLQTPGRGAQAGIRQIGLGFLLGLGDFRVEGCCLGRHLEHLQKKFWRTWFGLSFPRFRPLGTDEEFTPEHPVTDAQLVQLIVALRLVFPDAPFSLSTREPAELRRALFSLGFTQVSAGSCTSPGGYGQARKAGEQFEVEDERSPDEVARELRDLGFEVVWKDWDEGFGSEARA